MVVQSDLPLRPRSSGRYYIMSLIYRQLCAFIEQAMISVEQPVIVDYGCGQRPYEPLFAPYNDVQYIGADLADNPQAEVYLTNDGALPLDDESADLVLSTQVLEHVLDPMLYLMEAGRVLKPGGRLILSTHGYWMFHPHPTDLWRWTSQGLRHIVEHQGFLIEDFAGLMGLPATGLHLFQDGVGMWSRLPRRVRPAFYWLMQWLIQIIDNPQRQGERKDAAVYMLVARKPEGES